MTTAVQAGPITADDIKALKVADSITAHHSHGTGRIIAIGEHRRFGEPRIFTATQQRLLPDTSEYDRRRILPLASTVTGYDQSDAGFGSRWIGDERTTAFEMFHGGYSEDKVRTIVDLLRAGDTLALSWHGDAFGNLYSKSAVTTTDAGTYTGLHIDELRLIVSRGEHRMVFSLDVSVCPENTARMVRRYG